MIFKLLTLLLPLIMAETQKGTSLSITVNGMVCSFCAQGVEKKFKARAEINTVEVDLDTKTVHLTFKQNQTMPEADIKKMIQDSGFDVVSVEKKNEK